MSLSELINQGLRIAPFVALVSMRVAMVFAMMPAPFGEVAPTQTRAALSFIVAFVIAIPVLGNATRLSVDPVDMFRFALTEFLVGAVIGLTVRVTLAACETAGTLAGNAMGLGFANTMDPLLGSEGVPTTSLLGHLGAVIFFSLRGHHTVIQALSATLTLAPSGGEFPAINPPDLILLGAGLVAQGLRIAAPVVATMFVVQLGTALVARAAPRVQIFSLAFGLTISIGSLVLVVCAPQVAQGMAVLISNIPDLIAQVLPRGVR